MNRRFALTATCVSLAVAVGLAEGAVRLSGKRPWPSAENDERNPRCFAPDPDLGWTNKPGVYRMPPYEPGTGPVTLTHQGDGTRSTGGPDLDPASREWIALVGCSLMQGWAVTDEETMAWKLQQRFPRVPIKNYGTGGYSSYQCLLRLERLLLLRNPPRWVVYGLGDFHEGRSVADAGWLRLLASHEQRGHVAVPYVSLDEKGRLERHAPAPCPRWPLLRSSALVALLHETWLDHELRGREVGKRETAFRVVSDMANAAKAHGARFLVSIFWASGESHEAYVRFLEKSGIDFVDGTLDWTEPREDLLVPVDGHPNGAMQTRWAKRLGDRLEKD